MSFRFGERGLLSSEKLRERQALYFLREGFYNFQQNDYEAVKQWLERGVELYPEDIPNKTSQLRLVHKNSTKFPDAH